MAKMVIALGGNALGNTPIEQQEMVAHAAIPLVALIKAGHQVVITHGNGPQVGMLFQAFETARAASEKSPFIDLAECTAMSQGYIGFHLEKALQKELKKQGLTHEASTVLTQVLVDGNDAGFMNPTKPIGAFYNEAEAAKLMQANSELTYVEDSGRGWRRVVASPKPVDIIEKYTIMRQLDTNGLVIACGGGGIPVVATEDTVIGVSAVIDKDFASAKLAELVGADYLFILTAVDQVSINFGKPDQIDLKELRVADAYRYIEEGHFAPGSMLPKIEAALQFVEQNPQGKAIIGSLDKAVAAINGDSGTVVTQ